MNDLKINTDETYPFEPLDYSSHPQEDGPQVFFKSLDTVLISKIMEADAVLGCVAWLTHTRIIDALLRTNCSIIVQKEDLWRPDIGSKSLSKLELQEKYKRFIRPNLCRFQIGGLSASLSTCAQQELEGIRCVGNYNREKSPTFPRMHHKFFIFCNESKCSMRYLEPYAVWTGSFNPTFNATKSLENAVYLTDPKIISAFMGEYGQTLALSEGIDWNSDWSSPEYRIGS